MLLGLCLRNYQSLEHLELGLTRAVWERALAAGASAAELDSLSRLQELTVLIGRNASGKSSVLGSLGLLSALMRHDLPYATNACDPDGFAGLLRHGSREPLEIEVLLSLPGLSRPVCYRIAIRADAEGRPRLASENLALLPGARTDGSGRTVLEMGEDGGFCELSGEARQSLDAGDRKRALLPLVGRLTGEGLPRAVLAELSSWYFCRFLEDAPGAGMRLDASRHERQGPHHRLNETASNIPNVIAWYERRSPALWRKIQERIAAVHPAGRRLREDWLKGSLSAAEERFLALLLLLEDPDPRPLLLIENPDSGLYHDSVTSLGDELRRYGLRHEQSQIIMSTHNPVLLESFAPREVWVLSRGAGDRALQASALPLVAELYEEGIGMAAIWYAGHLEDPATDTRGEPDATS
ncbi:MAG: AAA family ATPase [Bacillota bacterium]|nr:AAA family ATPase [Bacillota bacterium]